jgi:hypothetical protein
MATMLTLAMALPTGQHRHRRTNILRKPATELGFGAGADVVHPQPPVQTQLLAVQG